MHQSQGYHFIGLDIHKRTISYCEKSLTGETVDRGVLRARRADLHAFARSRTRPWVGGMEATLFSGWIYDELKPYAMELRVGHPTRLKAVSKNKSDKVDAELLAGLLRADLFPACYMPSPQVRDLRRILRYRTFMVVQATRMKNKASGILMELGVEYTKAKLHQKKYFSELLEGLTEVPASVQALLKMTRANVELFTSGQRQLLNALAEHKALRERVELLQTIGGVGQVTALTWALEVDDPNRFSGVKKAQSYCGLCAARRESGGKETRGPLSKERNPHLQTILIEAAKLAPSKHPHLARVRDAALEQDPNKNRATLAVARKLVSYLMAVDKSGQPFVAPEG